GRPVDLELTLDARGRGLQVLERLDRAVARVDQERQQQVLDPDMAVAPLDRLADRALEDETGLLADAVRPGRLELLGGQAGQRRLQGGPGSLEGHPYRVQG